MEISQDILDYCESCYKWDDDLRQEVYLKILEAPPGTEINKGWVVRVYNNLAVDRQRTNSTHARLLKDNADKVLVNLGLVEEENDPIDILGAQEDVLNRLDKLSTLLRVTLEAVAIQGKTPEEVADEEGTTANVIYKRIHDARRILQGDNL